MTGGHIFISVNYFACLTVVFEMIPFKQILNFFPLDVCEHVYCGPNAVCVSKKMSCECAEGYEGNPHDFLSGCVPSKWKICYKILLKYIYLLSFFRSRIFHKPLCVEAVRKPIKIATQQEN